MQKEIPTTGAVARPVSPREAAVALTFVLLLAGTFAGSMGCGPSRRDLEEQAVSRSASAEKSFNDGKYAEAAAATQEAMRLNTDLRNDSALADNYLLLANCQRQLGEYDSALANFQSTIEYFHSLNDQDLERRARVALAGFYHALFNDADALTIARDASTAAKVFSDVNDSYRALTIAARANHRLGRYEDELGMLAELARTDSQAHRGRDRVPLLRSTAEAFEASGEPERCEEVFARWRSIAASNGDSTGLSLAEYQRGFYLQSLGRTDSAFRAFSRALGNASKLHDIPLQADILYALGNLAYTKDRFEDARRYYADALALTQRGGSFALKALLGLAMAACDSKTAAPDAGLLKRCASAAEECRVQGFRPGEAFANFMMGRMSEAAGDPAAALPYYRRALDLHEDAPPPTETKVLEFIDTYLGGEQTGWYDPAIRLYCASGQSDSAFTAAERKNLADIADFYLRIPFKSADKRVNEQAATVQRNASALRLLQGDVLEELDGGASGPTERLVSLNRIYPQRQELLARSAAELQRSAPNFAWLLHPGRVRLAAVRDTLPAASALLEFVPEGDTLYFFVVARTRMSLRKAAVRRESLLSLIRDYNRLAGDNRLNANGTWISDQSVQSRLNGLASVLGKLLFAPVMQDLEGIGQLYIVLPPEFGWLPVHTLRWDDRPLAGRQEISYLPTAAALFFTSRPETPVLRVVGVGHPGRTTWDVEYELKDIRGFYDKATMLFDTMATLAHMMDSTYDVIHIAAEFQLDRIVPDNTRLILADGITPFAVRGVSLGELLAVPRPQALVFSSISPRPGVFSRYAALAFLANGTKTVVASEWQLDRKAKKFFGEGFYTALEKGLPAGEAYRNAVDGLLRQGEFSLPQRWGAYYRYGR